ncbi:MAG TPA: NHL repeat-containing protein [Pyrinomonadaceae bacterium]|jgi:streptogramin lyase|nr:NHL repeat-containing protein [Pyrinomonadaceae bacterium]
MPQPSRSNNRRRRLNLASAGLLLLLLTSGALFVYFRFRDRPRPTREGWTARVETLAGDGSPGSLDGSPVGSRFADPFSVVMDRDGALYVADGGQNNRIRKIAPDGMVSTLAGGPEGFADGQGSAAAFNTPSAIAIDASGNLYVADTGNNSIRKVTPQGVVSTIAGDGNAGDRDGPGRDAQFNGPIGVAVDADGSIYVADTYNDRIRKIAKDGVVSTLAGGAGPGYQDGPALNALFDTPCAVALTPEHELLIADTGNDRLRKLTRAGQIITLAFNIASENNETGRIATPLGLTATHDGFIYVTEARRGRIIQLSPHGEAYVLAGGERGFANGEGSRAQFNGPTGIASDGSGALYVADASNYLIRKLTPREDVANSAPAAQVEAQRLLPELSAETLQIKSLPWPLDPQWQAHEVVATMGEVRGSYQGESRDHLHSGIDIQGGYGAIVRAILEEKVSSPLSTWEAGGLNEGLRIGVMTYIHMRVGRNQQEAALDQSRFNILRDEQGKPFRVRVKRGTRFRVGDPLGSINRMYHVHLNFGPGGAEINPLTLPLTGFSDHVAPVIERDGIRLFDESDRRITEKRSGRLVVRGDVRIILEAYDQVDHNAERRRLGLYKLGYQVFARDGSPAKGFEQPRLNIEFDRLPSASDAVKLAYADSSGITVYGNATTRFLYQVTNIVRGGRAAGGVWHTSELPPGDYILRINALDYAGNEAVAGRDLPLTISR